MNKRILLCLMVSMVSANVHQVAKASISEVRPAQVSSSQVRTSLDENRYNHFIWDGSQKLWFEWWYTKVTLPASKESFMVVMGVTNPGDLEEKQVGTKAFVSFGDFDAKYLVTDDFSLKNFSAKNDSLDVKVGESFFSGEHFKGKVKNTSFDFTIHKKWAFNGMGWGMFIPNLVNIGWYPAQADAVCSGQYETNGKITRFQDAPCYQDRNWGTSFPKWWTWIVSNHFNEDPTAALAVGGGMPKILGHEVYEGVTVGLKYKGKEYAFRPNDLAKVKTEICFGKWKVSAENKLNRIEIEAYAPPEKFMDLEFMTPQGEVFHDLEALTGDVTVKLYGRSNRFSSFSLITSLTSDLTGIEYGAPGAQGFTKNTIFNECKELK